MTGPEAKRVAISSRRTSPKAAATPPDEEETSEQTEKLSPAAKKRGPYNVQRIPKKAATFRLPPDVLEYIDQARDQAAARGDRLTKDEAVTMAVRAFWGGKRQRRR